MAMAKWPMSMSATKLSPTISTDVAQASFGLHERNTPSPQHTLAADISKEDAIAAGKEAVADKLTGTIVKEIYVPKKIINIVQK